MSEQEANSTIDEAQPGCGPVWIAGHSIYLLYPFRWQPTPDKGNAGEKRLFKPSRSLSEVIGAPWQPQLDEVLRAKAAKAVTVPSGQGPQSATRAEEQKGETGQPPRIDDIWVESTWPIAADMDPYLARLLWQGSFEGRAQAGNTIKVWSVSAQNNVRNALHGRVGAARSLGPRLAITLSPAAAKRIESHQRRRQQDGDKKAIPAPVGRPEPLEIGLEFGEIRAFGFPTGYGLLVVQIGLSPADRSERISAAMLVECLVALCADRRLVWLCSDGSQIKECAAAATPSLREIAYTLLGKNARQPMMGSRVFTYTFAKVDAALDAEARRRLAIQLACKYTDDYRINFAAFDERLYQPFESIAHLAGLEGASTIVENAPLADRGRVSFLDSYSANAIEPRYLPVVVAAYHQFLTLLDLMQDSRTWVNLRAPTKAEAAGLRELRDRALSFRLFHRISHVSALTMINTFYQNLCHAFRLEGLLASVDRDIAELSAVLDARVKEAELIRARWFHRLTTTSLALISGATLGTIVVDSVPTSWINRSIAFASRFSITDWARHIGLGRSEAAHLFAFAVMMAFGFFAWHFSESGGGSDEEEQEVGTHIGRDWLE